MNRILLAALTVLAFSMPAGATEAGWALLREGGHSVLLRHARTSGTTDPANVDPEKCSTQVRLNDAGQQQARRMGALIAARAAPTDAVYSSRFCLAKDTADLVFRTDVETLPALDPLPADAAQAKANEDEILALISEHDGAGNLFLVTHLDVIRALTGQSPREGEALVVRPDGEGLHVLARIIFN